jgi:hypothetical protein
VSFPYAPGYDITVSAWNSVEENLKHSPFVSLSIDSYFMKYLFSMPERNWMDEKLIRSVDQIPRELFYEQNVNVNR